MTDKKTSDRNDKEGLADLTPGLSTSINLSDNVSDTLTKENKARNIDKKSNIKVKKMPPKQIEKENMQENKSATSKISKTAILSFIIALIALAGNGGLYYWQNQQHNLLEQNLLSQLNQQAIDNKKQIQRLLAEQKSNLTRQLDKTLTANQLMNQQKISNFEDTITRLSQNQPSDWLIHESEYLIRIAVRSIWLEQDTHAAINLLKDADQRISELNNPKYLSLRQLIHQDIEALKLMPVLNTEEVILTLMAMEKQLKSLPLAMIKIPESTGIDENFELTEDPKDWRSNLTKTWHKFLADFITVSRRTANVEPLMPPQYQQNLRENLALKLQLAQWAATKQDDKLYNITITDIQLWFTEYFDMDNTINQEFNSGLQSLSLEVIAYDYNNRLSSLKAIRKIIEGNDFNEIIPETQNKLQLPKQTEPVIKQESKLSEAA